MTDDYQVMRASRSGSTSFLIELDSEEELRAEHRTNWIAGGIRLLTDDRPALHSAIEVVLRGPSGREASVKAMVVAPLADGVALMFVGDADALLATLLPEQQPAAAEPQSESDAPGESQKTTIERLREMPRVQKIMFAPKADRTERAFLVQDNDPQVLTALLRNPRITIDEVVRIAKSSFLNYQVAELILNTGQFTGSVDVRVALVHNPKTPPQFALRLLPTLPESEVRVIARGAATSMQLKQAALKRLQGMK